MMLTVEHEINLDEMMEYVGDEIEKAIDAEGIDWNSLTDASRKELYKKIAEYILKEWV